jgi:hypothetical protein
MYTPHRGVLGQFRSLAIQQNSAIASCREIAASWPRSRCANAVFLPAPSSSLPAGSCRLRKIPAIFAPEHPHPSWRLRQSEPRSQSSNCGNRAKNAKEQRTPRQEGFLCALRPFASLRAIVPAARLRVRPFCTHPCDKMKPATPRKTPDFFEGVTKLRREITTYGDNPEPILHHAGAQKGGRRGSGPRRPLR